MEVINKAKALCIAAVSALFSWLGVLAAPVFILLGCNVFDYATGIGAARKRNPGEERPVKSYRSIRGIFKKVCMYMLIIIGWFVDVLVDTTLAQLMPVSLPPVFAITITCWLIFNEIISILENMDDMEMEVPPFLLPILKKMKGQVEDMAEANDDE